ncbi:Rho GTPase activation protein [Zopfochytrium polystomum]|nr:Rho GTPase activation protein [Zopfochytrium polystomum]
MDYAEVSALGEDAFNTIYGKGPAAAPEAAENAVQAVADLSTVNGWTKFLDDGGKPYYWNEATDQTSWDPPDAAASNILVSVEDLSTPALPVAPLSHPQSQPHISVDFDPALFESVPVDLIRREGPLRKKVRKDDGKESKSGTWRSCYGVLCVGALLVFKEAPNSKTKKFGPVTDIIYLSVNTAVEPVGKEVTSKKNALMVLEENGRQWLFVPESDAMEWIDALRSAAAEKSSVAEYEGSMARIFSKQPSEGDGLAPPKGSDGHTRTSRPLDETQLHDRKPVQQQQQQAAATEKAQVRSKIGAFFAKKTKAKEEKAVLNSNELVFGGVLDLQLDKEGRTVPAVVEQCCGEVERRGITSQGIYRLSGNTATIAKMKVSYNQGETVALDADDLDINLVTGLLKSYFRELQNPLIPFEFYDQFIGSAKIQDYNERLITLKTLVQSLPQSNYQVLEYLMRHLNRIASHSDVNKMEPSNLAIVFAPTLIRIPNESSQVGYLSIANMPFHNTLIESMVQQVEWLFDGSTD